jgi:hypothetical protein
MIPIVLAFVAFDGWLSRGRTAGHERNTILGSKSRWAHADRAKVIILGSSTTAELLRPHRIARLLKRRGGEVISGHVNGCHHGCTWAEVQAIEERFVERASYRPEKKRPRHRFDHVFLGANLFQQCEHAHSKRVLQQISLVPATQLPALFGLYLQADSPLRYMGRALGMFASGAYGDTQAAKHRLGLTKAFRTPHHRWYTKKRPKKRGPQTCDYETASGLKPAFSRALIADLARLSKRVTLVLLPDRALSAGDPDQLAQLPAFRQMMTDWAAEHPNVDLVDLVRDNPAKARDYRDDIHFRRERIKQQRALFDQRFKAAR